MNQDFDLGDSDSDQEDGFEPDSFLPPKGHSGLPGISLREARDMKDIDV